VTLGETGPGTPRTAGASSLAPLRVALFRALWIASVASYVGTWMQDVGAAWLMTSLTTSPVLIASLQAAMTLPVFLLALPAGALADVVDRRRLLLVTQGWMLLTAAVLGLLTVSGFSTASILLAATFSLGLGTALNAPAWQAIIPELVPREQLGSALALNGAGINLARAAGPALGGLLIAAAGPGATFLLNAASFLGVLIVLARWRRPPRHSLLPTERILGAMRTGLRYVRHAPDLRSVMLRSGAFMLFGSAMWALLPAVARFELGVGPEGYGLLLAALGVGAVLGAAALPRLRRALTPERVAAAAGLVFTAVLLGMAWVKSDLGMGFVLGAAGAAWLVLLTTFHTAAQAVLPAWVRGRGLAVYLLVFFGAMALGSTLWGALAEYTSLATSLTVAAFGVLVGGLLTARQRLGTVEGMNLTPSRHWPAPSVSGDPALDSGPVLVTVEYRIDPARASEFTREMAEVRRIRLRDGALRWSLLNDSADPWRYVESFAVESWLEHLRQHERITVADRAIESRARAFHLGPEPPVVSHFIARDLPR
jgi:MFS family permease